MPFWKVTFYRWVVDCRVCKCSQELLILSQTGCVQPPWTVMPIFLAKPILGAKEDCHVGKNYHLANPLCYSVNIFWGTWLNIWPWLFLNVGCDWLKTCRRKIFVSVSIISPLLSFQWRSRCVERNMPESCPPLVHAYKNSHNWKGDLGVLPSQWIPEHMHWEEHCRAGHLEESPESFAFPWLTPTVSDVISPLPRVWRVNGGPLEKEVSVGSQASQEHRVTQVHQWVSHDGIIMLQNQSWRAWGKTFLLTMDGWVYGWFAMVPSLNSLFIIRLKKPHKEVNNNTSIWIWTL